MILGHGIDIVDVDRIAKTYTKFGDRFLQKILSQEEFEDLPDSDKAVIPFLAKHFAVKEATSKAIGCGLINGSPLHFRDVVLQNYSYGKPYIKTTANLVSITSMMYDLTDKQLENLSFFVSTSGDAGVCIASVIIELV